MKKDTTKKDLRTNPFYCLGLHLAKTNNSSPTKPPSKPRLAKTTQKTNTIHKECGGQLKKTLGNSRKYGTLVCISCGVFFD